MRIEKLTESQIAQFPVYVDRWLKIGLSTEPLDFENAKKAVALAYKAAKLTPPKFHFVFDSPYSAAIAAAILKNGQVSGQVHGQVRDQVSGQVHGQVYGQVRGQVYGQVSGQVHGQVSGQVYGQVYDQVSGQVHGQVYDQVSGQVHGQVRDQVYGQIFGAQDASWLSFYAFFKEVCGLKCCDPLEGLLELAKHCGWWAPYNGAAILQHRPSEIHKTSRGLHRDGGPAVLYRDGFSVWALNGVRVPAWLAETPAEQLDPNQLLKIDNAQVRAEFVRKVGAERLVHKLGAKVISRRGDYQLLKMEFEFGPRVVHALKMLNPSVPELWHVEFVPPDCNTVQKALNFRNGTNAVPKVLT